MKTENLLSLSKYQISLAFYANRHSNTHTMKCTQANPYARPTHTTNIIHTLIPILCCVCVCVCVGVCVCVCGAVFLKLDSLVADSTLGTVISNSLLMVLYSNVSVTSLRIG